MSEKNARLSIISLLMLICFTSAGQFWDSGSGLLQAPSADMNKDGTFMITNNFLNEHSLSPRFGYNTFGYGFSITLWSRLEVNYVMTIFDGKRHPNPTERDLITFNQDRHFSAKALLLLSGAFIEGTITSEQKADKQPLSKISAILKKRAKRMKLIDKEMTLAVAQKIDEAVAKM